MNMMREWAPIYRTLAIWNRILQRQKGISHHSRTSSKKYPKHHHPRAHRWYRILVGPPRLSIHPLFQSIYLFPRLIIRISKRKILSMILSMVSLRRCMHLLLIPTMKYMNTRPQKKVHGKLMYTSIYALYVYNSATINISIKSHFSWSSKLQYIDVENPTTNQHQQKYDGDPSSSIICPISSASAAHSIRKIHGRWF